MDEDLAGVIIYLILAVLGVMAGIYKKKQRSSQATSGNSATVPADTQPKVNVDTDYDPFSGLFDDEPKEELIVDESKEEFIVNKQETEYFIEESEQEGEKYTVDEREIEDEETYGKEYEEGEAVFKETKEIILSDKINDDSRASIFEDTEIPLNSEIDEHITDKKDFNLRDAIIYSEIINRKEF